MAEFENQEASRFQVRGGLGDEVGVQFVAFFAAVESEFGFVVADFAGERRGFAAADVRRVGGDKVERKWRVASGEWRARRNRLKQVGFNEMDLVGEAEAGGVALGYGESGGGNVEGVDLGGG